MKKLASALALTASVLLSSAATAPAAMAHGYVSNPPSRQAQCAQGIVADCGPIRYEPQSVEAPKGRRSCSGGIPQFAVLDDESRNWRATPVSTQATFSWQLTAQHSTSTWEYYIGGQRIATFDDGGRKPNLTVTHRVDLRGFSGRQKVLAIWNIGDTSMAFYNCVDVVIGGGSTTPTTGAPTPTTSTTIPPGPVTPPTTVPPGPVTPPPGPTTWAAGTSYRIGDRVDHGEITYTCRQSHKAQSDWEPQNTLALWLPVPGSFGNQYRAI
jgi:chitin-binding protein